MRSVPATRPVTLAGALGALLTLLAAAAPAPAQAQTDGAVAGRVRDAQSGRPIANVLVTVGDGRRGGVTDTAGFYRIREVRSGSYTIQARLIGYRPVSRDSVRVRAGETTLVDFALQQAVVELGPVTVVAADPVLDPLATATEQTITARDLRTLPVSSVDEAVALSAGAVGTSYRGGRLGQESFIIDGLGVKNQVDASSGSLGLRLPPDMLTEVSLVTNGFSARYGQALSGLVNVVTKDGGERWSGRAAYETDRPFAGRSDLGLDRFVLVGDGPLVAGMRGVFAADVTGRLDADPVNAPAPSDPRDPRAASPGLLPHNSGEQYNVAGKLTIPVTQRQTLRLFGSRSVDQRLLYDPLYKYDPEVMPASKTVGMLLSGHLQHTSAPTARLPLVADLRVGYFMRDFVRGQLAEQPDYAFGAFTGQRFSFVDEVVARAQDTVAARAPLPGYAVPELSANTPWGVPAFFYGTGSRGELAWNQFRELRSQLDVTLGLGARTDLYVGGEAIRQKVRTFERALAYLPVGDSVPPATAGTFTPLALAAYSELQARVADLGLTLGLRYDRFDARTDLPGRPGGARQQFNPRFAVSTVLKGATVVVSGGSFSQPPDYQYLVDAAFDDTLRTGRFRMGNPNLGFEKSWQWEMSVRGRLRPDVSLKVNTFIKRLEGLVASVPLGFDPDSSIFGNSDLGNVKGAELLFERELHGGWGLRASYTLQQATATSTSAFILRRAFQINPFTGDTVFPAKVEFPLDYDRRHNLTLILQGEVSEQGGPRILGVRPLGGLEAALIGRYSTGLPYTALKAAPDTFGIPNAERLPSVSTVDLLVRRPLALAGLRGSVYLDGRNVLNRRNIIAVRRDSKTPFVEEATVQQMAKDAYEAHPEPIPYESPRYRADADTNHDGYLQGDELRALYLAAALDATQPLFFYGSPRVMRLGMEFVF
ncbi:MAG TPA: TonB-dependent receptor [Gemmatimonadales bacterium]|nr:TonB-dependent receptor [Gemmatimonadales bacterium]